MGNRRKFNLEPKNDGNSLGALWEHQELIDQLEMEVQMARPSNLGTILEESEKLEHEKCIWELQKSYQCYTQIMRKLDILNYQKMYALGFLQLKDPFQSSPHPKKSPAPLLKPFVFQNLWLFQNKSRGMHPMTKLIHELHGDLEVVYVGQMCSSWELLKFQYNEALNLCTCDPYEIYEYNEVVIEFQKFQALMQRFVMDEHGQGSRVQSYVKNRCVLHNLLQVPLVRGECLKSMAGKKDFTSEMLVEMIRNSIQTFWQFVQSDKDCNSKKFPHLHNSQDLKLLLQVRKILQKKEKKVKDTLRGENCILRKFRENREDDEGRFVSQVDMKLVSRVLRMSNLTRAQLIWCGNKLSKINFVNTRIYVEPSFSLFPFTT